MDAGWLEELRTDLERRQLDLGEVLQRVVDGVTARLEADRGTLYLVDRANGELVSRVAHLPELAEIRLALGEGIAGWVAEQERPVRMPAPSEDPRFAGRIDAQTGYRTDSVLAVPVRSKERVIIGVIQLLNHRSGSFSAEDQRHLEALAVTIAELLGLTSLAPQLHGRSSQPLQLHYNHMVGEAPAMLAVYDRIARAAGTEATVLVRGESGSGKELVARAVHDNSPRRAGPFVVVDCAALKHELVESELFGHERGAFTGAHKAKAGRVEQAEGGTLFLDEIAEIPLGTQAKLLRLLQERTYTPVGGTRVRRADCRFVCATHQDLEAMVRAGRFREDLYYRLDVVPVRVPPLRERGPADLDRLVDHFLYRLSERHGLPPRHLSPAARARLKAHTWPGNVRELQNCIERAVVLARAPRIEAEQLDIRPGPALRELEASAPGEGAATGFSVGLAPLREVERAYVRFVLEHTGGNRTRAAELLGIGRNTLLRKLQED